MSVYWSFCAFIFIDGGRKQAKFPTFGAVQYIINI